MLRRSSSYVVDFGDVKAHMRKACKALNERFLCPCKSDVLAVSTETPGQVSGVGPSTRPLSLLDAVSIST